MNTLVIVKVLLLAAASLASQESQDEPHQKVEVAVYYEALCPDSVKFFNEQLTPNLNIINKYVQLKHVPFGRATHELIDGVWNSTCRHTAAECLAHQFQACVIKHQEQDYLRNEYISCLMKDGKNKQTNPTKCGEGVHAGRDNDTSEEAIGQCIADKEFNVILEEFKNETTSLQPPLSNVPTIVFNGVYKKNHQDMALTDFKTVLCEYVLADFPSVPECAVTPGVGPRAHGTMGHDEPPQKVEVAVYYEALCPDSVKFFNEQLTPHLDLINKYVQLKHVPFGLATHELVDGVWKSKCRHLATECAGHKVQACALLQKGNDSLRNAFISCLMKKGASDKPYPTVQCSTEVMFPGDRVAFETCISQKQYDEKLEELKTETESLQPPLEHVPIIVFNGVFQPNDQNMALTNFEMVLCHYIKKVNAEPVPECRAYNSAASEKVLHSLVLAAVAIVVVGHF